MNGLSIEEKIAFDIKLKLEKLMRNAKAYEQDLLDDICKIQILAEEELSKEINGELDEGDLEFLRGELSDVYNKIFDLEEYFRGGFGEYLASNTLELVPFVEDQIKKIDVILREKEEKTI